MTALVGSHPGYRRTRAGPRLDVIVNNAGYGQFGIVEEISEAEIRAQLETNLLGALWVTQAALPYLREQGSGHIVQGRMAQLARLGIPRPLADIVADHVDWHEIAALVQRGCAPRLALRIVL